VLSILGLSLCAAGTLGLAILPWPTLCGAIGLYGFGLGTCIPAINLAIAQSDSYKVGRVAILNACWTLGALSGPLLLQAVYAPGLFLMGLATACALVAAGGLLVPRQPVTDAAAVQAGLRTVPQFWTTAVFAALFFICIGTENAISGWITFYSVPIFHDEYRAMTSAAVFWAAFLAGRLVSPLFIREANRDAALVVSSLLAIVGILFLLFIPGIQVLVLGTALAGLGFATIYPILITQMSGALGARTPFATVCFAFSGLGAATLPYVSGRISNATGNTRNGLALSAVLLVLLISLYAGLRNKYTTSRIAG
jgi:MFS transporter, FHS family, glucose/mannose:H+ symporter